ncbi:actin [Perkinsus olseni]|uniref:Actin n=1 Tax=Perkinsus olseni TaxID=32597 RepID=A0A7J6PDW5_PEROL|nr:actin [Perkinsus olseni]
MASSSSSSSYQNDRDAEGPAASASSSRQAVLDDYRQRHQRRYEEREAEAAREEQEDADLKLAQTLQSHEEVRLQQEIDLKHAEEVHRAQEIEQRQRELLVRKTDRLTMKVAYGGYTERLIDDSEFATEDQGAGEGFASWCPLLGIFRPSTVSERELLPLRDPDEEDPAEDAPARLLVARQGFGPMRWITAALTDGSDAPTAWRCCQCFVVATVGALIEKAMELQKTLSEMTYRAEEVRLQNAALEEENDLLKEYIESFITRQQFLRHLVDMSGLSPQLSPIPKPHAPPLAGLARRSVTSVSSAMTKASLRRRPTAVIDMGVHTWKVGFATESKPRWRIRSLHDRWEDWTPDELESFLGHVLLDRLLVSPPTNADSWGDTRILVLENMFTPRYIRDSVRLCCGSLSYPGRVRYAIGQPTALVVDMGHSSSRVVPVFACMPVMEAAVERHDHVLLDEHSHSGDEILELVVSAMVEAVTKCPIDVRRHVASKVYFVGGRSRCVSLEADILEAFALLVSDKLPNFSSESITVFDTDPSMDPTDLIWIGASIYGGRDHL